MKKILLVGPFRTLNNPVGGVSTFLENLQKSPIGKRYKLIQFTTLRPEKKVPRLSGYDSILRAGPLNAAKSAFVTVYHLLKFPFIVLRERPIIVQIHTSSYWTFWENGCYVVMAKLLGRKVILRYGGAAPEFFLDAGPLQQILIRLILRSCDFMIVQGKGWKNFFSEWLSDSRLFVLPNSVDFNKFAHSSRIFVREKCVVLFMGGDEAVRKGLYDIFAILQQSLEANSAIRFHIVADCDSTRPKLRAALQSRLQISPRLDGASVVSAYADADIFLLPSYGEGFPNALLEAMASGVPVITTPVGAISEVISNKNNGLMIDPGDQSALLSQIITLANDIDQRRNLSESAVVTIQTSYDRDEVFITLEKLYKTILAS